MTGEALNFQVEPPKEFEDFIQLHKGRFFRVEETTMKEVRIMDEGAISRALTRISYEIIEQQKDVSNLVIIGIKTRGITLAKRVAEKISALEKKKSSSW